MTRTMEDASRRVSLRRAVLLRGLDGLTRWRPKSQHMGSATLNHLGKTLPAWRDVVLRIISSSDNAALQCGIQYVQRVFSRLHQREMLTAMVVPPPDREGGVD
ncbi:hypothetical protein B0H16DRAFT_1482907 [Mycena metata]|uniref:Uncharacterized protein n=1 Tax=Mycena metata TaxID=1033252 RepID=A0AAD7GNW1_9AGAR|nr:hypothetical protein B0H16DRAFT_1482907 [Mycena metata]